MKYLLVLVMLIASPAWAEWTLIGETDNHFQYADIATIRRNGNFVKMWDFKDYKTVQNYSGGSYLSTKVRNEYDCKEERRRILALSRFNGPMGNGKAVYNDSDFGGKWSPIEPDSIGEDLWKIACGKR